MGRKKRVVLVTKNVKNDTGMNIRRLGSQDEWYCEFARSFHRFALRANRAGIELGLVMGCEVCPTTVVLEVFLECVINRIYWWKLSMPAPLSRCLGFPKIREKRTSQGRPPSRVVNLCNLSRTFDHTRIAAYINIYIYIIIYDIYTWLFDIMNIHHVFLKWYACIYIYIYTCMYMYVHDTIYISIVWDIDCIHMYIYIYIFVYMYIYMYILTNICIHVETWYETRGTGSSNSGCSHCHIRENIIEYGMYYGCNI